MRLVPFAGFVCLMLLEALILGGCATVDFLAACAKRTMGCN